MFWTHVFPYIAATLGLLGNHKLRGMQLIRQTRAITRTTIGAKAMLVNELTTRDTRYSPTTPNPVAATPDNEDVRIRQP